MSKIPVTVQFDTELDEGRLQDFIWASFIPDENVRILNPETGDVIHEDSRTD